jgi:intracellular protein transport protein USO1
MEFLNQTMFALRGPTGQPQTASDTIGKLADRLGPSTLLADRRAAVLTLKGLSRKHSEEVAARCLQGLLSVLATDASIDADIGRAALETLFTLCRTDEQHDLGLQHSDSIIAATDSVHTIFSLIQDEDYYVRYEALRLLVALLQNRRQAVQAQFLKAPSGAAGLIHALEDRREIIRNGR